MKVLVTGSAGFVGKHLMEALGRRPGVEAIGYDLGTPDTVLEQGLRQADVIFHLAGVNRPQKVEEFKQGNADFTQTLCDRLLALGRTPLFVLSSSIQAELDNPYGLSKRQAEKTVEDYAQKCQTISAFQPSSVSVFWGVIFRLKNVFGKWCRPNYNSVTATFCHNIAHDLPIAISDPARELKLVYIDDVVDAFLAVLDKKPEVSSPAPPAPSLLAPPFTYQEVARSYTITLGELAARIRSFHESRQTLMLPAMDDELTRKLYVTYLSYLDGPDFAYPLDQKVDPRGSLAEFLKLPALGQIFISRTKPGITRGNHYHHSKTEKFFVVEGEAVIRFRHINGTEVVEHHVSGREFKVVDIPPGYTHSIENVGTGEMVCIFWASEIFNPQKPDTYYLNVK
jgi:UDP-2-acetamido-2,6-beta-L-arabino-hexul-4-ose reductase